MKSIDDIINAATETLKSAAAPKPAPAPEKIARMGEIMVERGYHPHEPAIFRKLAWWLAVNSENKTGKTLTLCGVPGVGKTFFMELFINKPVPAMRFVDAYRECQSYGDGFWKYSIGIYDSNHADKKYLVIDDLGTEPTSCLYGQVEEVLSQVIFARHNAWRAHGCRTFFTSNLTVVDLEKRYGRRVTDRIKEMSYVVEFNGQSIRK